MQRCFRLIEVRLDLLAHLAQPALLLFCSGRVAGYLIAYTQSAGQGVILIQQLLPILVRLLHELGYALVSEVVNHLDFDLLEDLSTLLPALSCNLYFKLLLRRAHINTLDRVLIFLCRHDQTISVVGSAALAHGVHGGEGCDALEDDVNELDVERGS